jgi:hypothetical protein
LSPIDVAEEKRGDPFFAQRSRRQYVVMLFPRKFANLGPGFRWPAS